MRAGSDEPRLPAAGTLLIWLVMAILVAVFLSRFVLVGILAVRIGAALLLSVAALVAVAGTGAAALLAADRISGVTLREGRSFAWYVVTGYPIFGALCFLAGLVSTSDLVMTALLLAMIAVAGVIVRPLMPSEGSREFGPAWAAGLLVIGAAVLPAIALAQLPASSLDELSYHLAIPQTWVTEGRVVDLPLLSQSYFPLGSESADLPLLAILGTEGSIASHFLHLYVALAVVFLIYEWLRRRLSATGSMIATAAISTCPALLVTAGWSWNDWAAAGVSVALFFSLDDLRADISRRNIAAVAVALAAGMLTKYTFYPIAGGLFLALLLSEPAIRSRLRELAGVLSAGLAAGSVFLIRNLFLTGNPFSPFLQSDAPAVSHFRDGETLLGKAANYIFDGRLIDESLGVTILILAVAAFPAWTALREERFLRMSWLITLVTAALVYSLGPSSRVLVPWLAILAMIGAVAVERQLGAGIQRRMIRAALLALCLPQLFLVWYHASTIDPFAVLSGRQSDAEYLTSYRDSFSVGQAASSAAGDDAKLLAVGLNELFWFTVPVRGGGNFDGPRVAAYLDAKSAAALHRKLVGDGFTHLLVYPPGIRTGPVDGDAETRERQTFLPAETAAQLKALTEGSELVSDEAGALLYRLRPPV